MNKGSEGRPTSRLNLYGAEIRIRIWIEIEIEIRLQGERLKAALGQQSF